MPASVPRNLMLSPRPLRRALPGERGCPSPRRARRICSLLLGLFLPWVIQGCGPAPRKADLVVGVERGPSSLDPRIGSDQGSQRLYDLVHRSLFKPGPALQAVPDLAGGVEILSGTHYRITMRRGVRYPDGREVTASDVAFTLRSILRGEVISYRRGDLERIERIETSGRYTLDLHLTEPYAPLLDTLTIGILPEGTPANAEEFPGCGPYRITRVTPGQWVLLRANDAESAVPRSETVALKIIPDAVVRSLELRRGKRGHGRERPPSRRRSLFSATGLPGPENERGELPIHWRPDGPPHPAA